MSKPFECLASKPQSGLSPTDRLFVNVRLLLDQSSYRGIGRHGIAIVNGQQPAAVRLMPALLIASHELIAILSRAGVTTRRNALVSASATLARNS